MSTYEKPIEQQRLLTFCMRAGLTTPYEAAAIAEWSKVPYSKLIGRPDLELQKKHYEAREQALREHPAVDKNLRPAPAPTLSAQRHHSPDAMKATVNDAAGNHTLQQQNAPQSRSVGYGQSKKKIVAYDQSQVVKTQPVTKSEATLTTPQLFPEGIPQVNRSQAVTPAIVKGPFYRFIGRSRTTGNRRFELITKGDPVRSGENLYQKNPKGRFDLIGKAAVQQPETTGRVVWRGPGGSTLTRVDEPAQLPVSPYTGQPSQIRAAVLQTTGQPQPALNPPKYVQDEQIRRGQVNQQALPISPFTGQPSQITAVVRMTS